MIFLVFINKGEIILVKLFIIITLELMFACLKQSHCWILNTQLAFTCSKSTTGTPEQCVKLFQS